MEISCFQMNISQQHKRENKQTCEHIFKKKKCCLKKTKPTLRPCWCLWCDCFTRQKPISEKHQRLLSFAFVCFLYTCLIFKCFCISQVYYSMIFFTYWCFCVSLLLLLLLLLWWWWCFRALGRSCQCSHTYYIIKSLSHVMFKKNEVLIICWYGIDTLDQFFTESDFCNMTWVKQQHCVL